MASEAIQGCIRAPRTHKHPICTLPGPVRFRATSAPIGQEDPRLLTWRASSEGPARPNPPPSLPLTALSLGPSDGVPRALAEDGARAKGACRGRSQRLPQNHRPGRGPPRKRPQNFCHNAVLCGQLDRVVCLHHTPIPTRPVAVAVGRIQALPAANLGVARSGLVAVVLAENSTNKPVGCPARPSSGAVLLVAEEARGRWGPRNRHTAHADRPLADRLPTKRHDRWTRTCTSKQPHGKA